MNFLVVKRSKDTWKNKYERMAYMNDCFDLNHSSDEIACDEEWCHWGMANPKEVDNHKKHEREWNDHEEQWPAGLCCVSSRRKSDRCLKLLKQVHTPCACMKRRTETTGQDSPKVTPNPVDEGRKYSFTSKLLHKTLKNEPCLSLVLNNNNIQMAKEGK